MCIANFLNIFNFFLKTLLSSFQFEQEDESIKENITFTFPLIFIALWTQPGIQSSPEMNECDRGQHAFYLCPLNLYDKEKY